VTSTNFAFLAKGHDPLFLQLAEAAERTLAVDSLRIARRLARASNTTPAQARTSTRAP
jgi:hypothetical protein